MLALTGYLTFDPSIISNYLHHWFSGISMIYIGRGFWKIYDVLKYKQELIDFTNPIQKLFNDYHQCILSI